MLTFDTMINPSNMKKLFYSLFLFFSVFSNSNAQNESVSDFYTHLNNSLEDAENKSIELLITNYGCLGNKIYSEAKLTRKGNKIKIQHFSLNSKDSLEKKLDTTFVISKNKLIDNFKNEICVIFEL